MYWRSVVHTMPLSPEQLQCVLVKLSIPSAKVISPRRTSHKSLLHSAPTAPIHTLLAMTTTLHRMPSCKGCSKKGHWHAKCHSSGIASQQSTKSDGAEKAPPSLTLWKGEESYMVQVNAEEAPPCNELFINTVNCGMVGDIHPEEILVDNVCAPCVMKHTQWYY